MYLLLVLLVRRAFEHADDRAAKLAELVHLGGGRGQQPSRPVSTREEGPSTLDQSERSATVQTLDQSERRAILL